MIGAIVAGGASSRFGGKPKGLERVGGKRIIDRVADALHAIASELLIVSNDPNASEWLPQARVVADIRAERGSLVGLHSALAHAPESVVVVAWDMPFVTPELLRLIRDRGATEQFATVPEGSSGLEPFCAMYTQTCVPLIEAALGAGELRMSRFLQSLPSLTRIATRELEPIGNPARLFFNVNDDRDLAIAREMSAEG